MKNIIIFGTSANPPTIGHVLLLQYISSIANFDEILVVPVHTHPVKQNLIEFYHRFSMCRLAFENISKVIVDPIENYLPKPNYTYQTLEELIKIGPAKYSLLLGSDNLEQKSGWGENLEKALKLAEPYVVERNLIFNTSSTEVRKLIKSGEKDKLYKLCPRLILDYIEKNNLYKENKMTKIDSFSGDYDFLSNFHEVLQVSDLKSDSYSTIRPIRSLTVEHLFQASKTLYITEQVQVLNAKTPGQAKRLGRKVNLRKDWESVKIDIMRQLVLDKFSQNPDLKQKLLETGDIELIEGNTWGDKFWGTVDGVGQNWLGKILMETRGKLKNV